MELPKGLQARIEKEADGSLVLSTMVIDHNLIIADFMGVKIGVDPYSWRPGCTEPIRAEHLNYHASWDWLMPVVETIQALGFKFIIGDSNRVTVYNKDYDWRNGHTEDSLIECVWHGCVQFVTWYNSNKHQNG